MKYFLLFLLLSSPSFSSDNKEEIDSEQILYLETVNYRLNNLMLLQQINKTLKIIRCQTEISEYCDKLNQKLEEKQG